MERFTAYRDEAAGINPFTRQPYVLNAGAIIVGVVLLTFRLPLFLLCMPLFSLFDLLAFLLKQNIVGLLIRSFLLRPLARLLLFSLGFHTLEAVNYSRNSIRLSPSPANVSNKVLPKDVIVANKSSYVDILILTYLYAPIFIVPAEKDKYLLVSATAALRLSFTPDSLTRYSGGAPLKNVVSGSYGPFVIFPEEAPSNNISVLQFGLSGRDIGSLHEKSVHLVALKYRSTAIASNKGTVGAFSPTHLVGSGFVHLMQMMMQVNNKFTYYRLPNGFEPQPKDFVGTGSDFDWRDTAYNAFIGMLRTKPISCDSELYRGFVIAWKGVSTN